MRSDEKDRTNIGEQSLAIEPEHESGERDPETETDLVFDFSGLHRTDLPAMALILTARLLAGPDHRVWARSLPYTTWKVLRALGLDHLFRLYPGPGDQLD